VQFVRSLLSIHGIHLDPSNVFVIFKSIYRLMYSLSSLHQCIFKMFPMDIFAPNASSMLCIFLFVLASDKFFLITKIGSRIIYRNHQFLLFHEDNLSV